MLRVSAFGLPSDFGLRNSDFTLPTLTHSNDRGTSMRKIALTMIVLSAGGLLLQSSAAIPDRAELKLRDKWLARHFDGNAAAAPFSFTYGGRASGELLPAWKAERAKSGGAQRTLTWTDPATGLRVRAEVKAFADLPAVEWVLRFENQGHEDTPILERILPLAVAFDAKGQEKGVVHHSLGEQNTGQSFAPVEDVLAPGSPQPLVFAPVGGRSSDGHMPFFNLELPGRGVALAIGWSGQWEAGSSGRPRANSGRKRASSWSTANCTPANPSAPRACCWCSGKAPSRCAGTISCGKC